ncbi:cell adhesion molecule CEACAM15-like [Tautogolabrus adspersus]
MVDAFIVSVLLICCSITSCTGNPDAVCDKFAPAGGDFTLPLPVKVDATDRLKWKRNKENIFNKIGDSVTLGKPEDVSEDGSLKLRSVSMETAGTYEAEIHTKAGKIRGTFKTVLCVQERVNKPTIKMRCESDKSGHKTVIFTCSVTPVKGVSFRWHQNGKPLKDIGVSVKRSVEEVGKERVTCTVSNSVSNMSSEALGQDCIKSGEL